MMEVLCSEKCKAMDKKTIEDIGIPSIILMENAAIGIVNELSDIGKSFLIFCGKGNNGGDGLALARHLIMRGKRVKVYLVSNNENYTVDFKTNFNILKNITRENEIEFIKTDKDISEELVNDLKDYDIVVDGIFGVGLNRELEGIYKEVIEKINIYGKRVVSIDAPSGLDCNSGEVKGVCIRANTTYTFEVIKKGFLNNNATDYLGELKVLKIGIPMSIKEKMSEKFYMLGKDDYKNLIPKRKLYGHKGNYGRALIAAGSMGYTGAAFITTECTVRAGAGLTTLLCSEEVQKIVSNKLIEAMTINVNSEKAMDSVKNANSIAFGPGIGTSKTEQNLLEDIIKNSKCPMVIDADGITLLGNNKEILKELKGRCVITPHPGEMARFLNMSIDQIERDRAYIAKKIAKEYEIIVLLKGYNTIITDGENIYVNPTGNSKMASGGMGDALTGIINAFISQGMSLINATLLGAYIHGYIADELSNEAYIINARDIIRELPKKISELINN